MKRIFIAIVVILFIVGVMVTIYIKRSHDVDDTPMGTLDDPVEIDISEEMEEPTENGIDFTKKYYEKKENSTGIPQFSKGSELMGVFDTKEEAQKAAELYGIELVSYEQQVAVFSIEEGEDPLKIISKGEENGWPELAVNGINVLY